MSETGHIPFFICFRWEPFDEAGKTVAGIRNEFDWDVSSNGFPLSLKRNPFITFEPHGQFNDPGFVGPERGLSGCVRELRPVAPAAQSGWTHETSRAAHPVRSNSSAHLRRTEIAYPVLQVSSFRNSSRLIEVCARSDPAMLQVFPQARTTSGVSGTSPVRSK